MRTAISILLCSVVLVAAGTALAQPAPPDDAALVTARARYKRAVELFGNKSFDGALVEFQEAYRITKRWKVLYNIALTQMELKRWQDSLRTFQSYLAKGGAGITTKRRTLIETHMRKSRSNLAAVTVVVEGAPATLEVNGRRVSTTPMAEPLLLLSGTYVIRATRSGYRPATRTLTVLSGTRYAVQLKLELIPTTAQLTVRAQIDQVSLRIDGKRVGLAPWKGVLPAGGHNIVGTRSGYRARQLELALVAGKDREITLTLSPIAKPWYKRWYVWAGLGVAVVGGGGYAYYLCCVNKHDVVRVP